MKRSSADDKRAKPIFWTMIAVFFFCCFSLDAGAVGQHRLSDLPF